MNTPQHTPDADLLPKPGEPAVSLDDLSQRLTQAFDSGKWSEAQALCYAILARQPDHFRALHILGATHAKLENYEDALHFLGQALKIDAFRVLKSELSIRPIYHFH